MSYEAEAPSSRARHVIPWFHPELREGESFYKNIPKSAFREVGFPSKRLGEIAYELNESSRPVPYAVGLMYPVFVKSAELKGLL